MKAKLMQAYGKTVRLRASVTIDASAKPEEGQPPKAPAFSAIAYSGSVVPGYTAKPQLDHDFVVDLAGMTASRNVVANLDHDPKHRVGHITDVNNDKSQLVVMGSLSAATPHRDEVAQSAANGFNWEVSIEANLSKVSLLSAGKKATVNGKEMEGPMYIVRKSHLTGLAFVSQGADEGNTVNIAASAAGVSPMDEFTKWLIANDFDPETVTEKQKKIFTAQFEAQANPRQRTTGNLAGEASAMKMENERRDVIRQLCVEAMKSHPHLIDQIEAAGEAAMEAGLSRDAFELKLLRDLRDVRGFGRPGPAAPGAKVFEAALSMTAGLPNLDKHFSPEILDYVDSHGMKHFGLKQMLMTAACSAGYRPSPGESVNQGNLREILMYCFPQGPVSMQASGLSTVSLPGILSNVANKELLAGYMEEDQEWREISDIKSVPDFKTMTSYRMTDDMSYVELPKGGEIQHSVLSEESYTRSAKTYARMCGLDRQDIINDDLSAINDLRTRLGRGAAKKFNDVFWTEFMDNATFFTAARANYITGATTNLGVDGVGLTAGVLAFQQLLTTAVNGVQKRVGGQPKILLVPPELQWIARQHYASSNVNTGGAATATQVPNANVFGGLFRPVVSAWLSDSSFTGYGAKIWYLFRNPGILAPMVVSFLNGQQSPIVESTDADFNMLGIQFRGYFDWGCDKAEFLAGVKVKGEA